MSPEFTIMIVIGIMFVIFTVAIKFLSTPTTKIEIITQDNQIKTYKKKMNPDTSEIEIKGNKYKVIPEGIFYHFAFLKNYRKLMYKGTNPVPITYDKLDEKSMVQKMLRTKVASDYLDNPKPDYQNLLVFALIGGIMGFVLAVMVLRG